MALSLAQIPVWQADSVDDIHSFLMAHNDGVGAILYYNPRNNPEDLVH
jgi:hypothetical protein